MRTFTTQDNNRLAKNELSREDAWYLNKFVRKMFIAALWIIIWQIAYLKIGKEILLVSPFAVASRLFEMVRTLEFWRDSVATIIRIVSGFLLALVVGTIFAVLTNTSKIVYDFFYPAISVIKATPVASFILLAFLWLQSTNVPVFISFLMVFPVVWGNIMQGIKKTDEKLLEMADVFKFSLFKKIRYIYIPSIIPYFTAAATIGMGLSWKAGIAAEVLCLPKRAIGTKLYESKVYLDTADLFAWTVFVILLSMVIEIIVVKLISWLSGKKVVG